LIGKKVKINAIIELPITSANFRLGYPNAWGDSLIICEGYSSAKSPSWTALTQLECSNQVDYAKGLGYEAYAPLKTGPTSNMVQIYEGFNVVTTR
jgi:hypothetical protein